MDRDSGAVVAYDDDCWMLLSHRAASSRRRVDRRVCRIAAVPSWADAAGRECTGGTLIVSAPYEHVYGRGHGVVVSLTL